jgi:dolichol-phosphate mannosyltransferase
MNSASSPIEASLDVSFAIPVFNEEELISELVDRVGRVLSQLPPGQHEAVIVNDGSTDQTLELLEAVAEQDSRFTIIDLTRNFGHQAALTAALEHTRGDVVLVMDGDLQDPPEALGLFLQKYSEGFEVVYATRLNRKEGLLLRSCYFLYYRIVRRFSELDMPLDSGDFALLGRRAVEAICDVPERNRYLRGLRTWVGYSQCAIEVERSQRGAGRSKYSVGRLLRLASDGLFAFSEVPLRATTWLGLLSMLCAIGYAAFAVVALLLGAPSPRGFTSLIVAVVFLAGVQLFFLGILGEYVGRIYKEVKRRPHYLVKRVIGTSRG